MRHLDEFRDPAAARGLLDRIAAARTRPWTLMEVCGGQTWSILRYGLHQLLPVELSLLHGPGCPVCVTPASIIDQAIALAKRPGLILCSFGDMLRVPGETGDLLTARAHGADVRAIWSPLEVLDLARANPDRPVVLLAVGFETTAPTVAMAVRRCREEGISNLSFLISHVRVPPAVEAIAADPERRVDGFIAAGHVCTVMGLDEYRPIAARYRVPIVVTGFEPLDLLLGIAACVEQLEAGRYEVENAYRRVAPDQGNPAARALLDEVFTRASPEWRGLGPIPEGGLVLRERYADLDATRRFGDLSTPAPVDHGCQAGAVLTGRLSPPDCPQFGRACTPDRPLGAPMVSREGACAAFFHYQGPRPAGAGSAA